MNKYVTSFLLKRNRFLILGSALAFVVSIYVLMFNIIDHRLQSLNKRILKEVSFEKSQLVQKELDDLERSFNLMGFAADEGHQGFVNKLIEQDSVKRFLVAYTYWESNQDQYSKKLTWFNHEDAIDSTFISTKLLEDITSTKFIQKGKNMYLLVHIKTNKGILQLILDLYQVNDYLAHQNIGMRAYFELYDDDGICIMHPDLDRIGKKRKGTIMRYPVRDSVLRSDHLGIDVLLEEYKLKGIFSNGKFFVNVVLLMTEDEVRDIGNTTFLLGLLGITTMLFFMFLMDLQNRKAKRLRLKNLEYQKEDALLRFENLKRKVDPHFLFNALGSLQQLIGRDPAQAKIFVGKMAKVYRKFLSGDESGLATVKEEIALAEEYFFMQKIRFIETLNPLEIVIRPETMALFIPKFSLQILIENAIKHNELRKEQPLSITIVEKEGRLVVRNTVLFKNPDIDSAGYGTKMIAHVYDFYQVQGFEIQHHDNDFTVYLPFIYIDSR